MQSWCWMYLFLNFLWIDNDKDRSDTDSYTGANLVYYTEANGGWVMTCKVMKSNASELV